MSIHKPSAHENEYFAREDTDHRARLAIEQAHAQQLARQAEARGRAQLACPRCDVPMHQVQGAVGAAASCPTCRGMFLEAADVRAVQAKEGYMTHLLRQVADRAWR